MTKRIHGAAQAAQEGENPPKPEPPLYFKLPCSLDLETLLPGRRGRKLRLYAYLCHIIYERRIWGRKEEGDDPFVQLDSRLLQRMLTTKECRSVIGDLVRAGVIEVDGKFRIGKEGEPGKCLGYRFTPRYANQGPKQVAIHNKPLKKKAMRGIEEFKPSVGEVLGFLYRQLGRIRVDLPKGYGFVLWPARRETYLRMLVWIKANPKVCFTYPRIRPASRQAEWGQRAARGRADLHGGVADLHGGVLQICTGCAGLHGGVAAVQQAGKVVAQLQPGRGKGAFVQRMAASLRHVVAPVHNQLSISRAGTKGTALHSGALFSVLSAKHQLLSCLPPKAPSSFSFLSPPYSYPYLLPPPSSLCYHFLDFNTSARLLRLDRMHQASIGEVPWDFKVDGKTGRLFTNLTNLNKELRPFLRLDTGQRIVGIDIGECQPFLLGMLLLEQARSLWPEGLPGDVSHFLDLTESRSFYRFLMDRCGIAEGERDAFKKTIFGGIFYCSDWKAEHPDNLAGRTFIEHFPSVYTAIKGMKGRDRSTLPIQLMRKESEIVIHGVCRQVAEMGDEGFFLATIHDCILTTEDKADIVEGLLGGIFMKRYGRVPFLNREEIN
ncbi:hypothetical protein [Rufibacter hautae]|uniref:Uncharacterized protein n=1 Tax=Rufibacter hautae TaxID=2595005 RepID=A0A5B6TDY4_9BACT|nr:hypothetical protein [Rufibacter hautae]KAA3437141.1 hypothetical protein FOA19_22515 [Rufibacter hautae]